MKKIVEIAKVFTLIFVRDKVTLFFNFFFNAALMIIFGFTINDKYDVPFNAGIVDNSNNVSSSKIVAYLEKQPNMVIKKFDTEAKLKDAVSHGLLVAGLVINDKVSSGDVALTSVPTTNNYRIEIIGDESRNMWLKFLIPGLKLALAESNPTIKSELNNTEITTKFVASRNLKYFDFIFPGLLILSIMQIALTGGLTLLGLRHDESIKRLKITPLKKYEFLLGYGLSYLVLILIQVTMFIVLGMLLFNYSFSGNMLAIALIITVTGIIFLCLGILLSNWATTPEAGDNFNRFFTLPAAFLCGVYFPLDTLPDYIQKLALIHPLTHIISIFRGISNYSDSIFLHQGSFIIILVTLVVFSGLAVTFFKWEEKTA